MQRHALQSFNVSAMVCNVGSRASVQTESRPADVPALRPTCISPTAPAGVGQRCVGAFGTVCASGRALLIFIGAISCDPGLALISGRRHGGECCADIGTGRRRSDQCSRELQVRVHATPFLSCDDFQMDSIPGPALIRSRCCSQRSARAAARGALTCYCAGLSALVDFLMYSS